MNAPNYESARFILKKKFVEEGLNISQKKINSFCIEGGFNKDEVEKKIKNDEMFRWFFVIDPIRQNFYENLFLDFVKTIDGVTRVHKSNGSMLYDGNIVSKRAIKERNIYPACKSIDASWKYGKYDFYVYHKYAKKSGGHQDNQYQDVQCFITEANKVKIPNTIFLAIVDGAFWSTRNCKAKTSKKKKLQQMSNNKTVFTITSKELNNFLKSF